MTFAETGPRPDVPPFARRVGRILARPNLERNGIDVRPSGTGRLPRPIA